MKPQISFHPEQFNMSRKVFFFLTSVVNVLLKPIFPEPPQFNGDLYTEADLTFTPLHGSLL